MTNQLGFGESPQPTKIFIGKENGALWYFWRNNAIDPIPASTLTGYVRSIQKKDFVSDYGTSEKLIITVEADRAYDIVSGYNSWFSKSFLLAMRSLCDEALSRAIAIEPYSNSSSKVIFCNLYDWSNTKIYSDWQWEINGKRNEPNLDEIFIEIATRLEKKIIIKEDEREKHKISF